MKNRVTKIADYSCCAIARLMISMYKTSWGDTPRFQVFDASFARPIFNPFFKLMESMLREVFL